MSTLTRLPPAAQQKFARIAAMADDADALARAAMASADSASMRARLLAQRQPRDDAEAQTFAAELDAAEQEADRLRALQSARRARYLEDRQLLTRLEQWIEVSRPGVEFEQADPPALRTSDDGPVAAVAHFRSEIADVRRKLAQVAAAPLPADEVKARARARVEQLAASGAPKITVERGRVEVEFRRPGAHAPGMNGPEVAAMLAWLHRDAMLAAMEQEVDALRIEGGISDVDRARQTNALRDQLLAIERAEELLIEQAQAAGQDIGRRADANPVAVLALRIVSAAARAA